MAVSNLRQCTSEWDRAGDAEPNRVVAGPGGEAICCGHRVGRGDRVAQGTNINCARIGASELTVILTAGAAVLSGSAKATAIAAASAARMLSTALIPATELCCLLSSSRAFKSGRGIAGS